MKSRVLWISLCGITACAARAAAPAASPLTGSDPMPPPAHAAPSPPATHETSATAQGALSSDHATPADPPAFLPEGCPDVQPGLGTWRPVDPASLSSNEVLSLNYSRCEWAVTLDGGLVTPSPHAEVRPETIPGFHLPSTWGPPRRIIRRPPGILIGFNRGEWGGALLWYSAAGALQGTLLSENVVEVLPGVGASIVFTGLAHLGGDRGRVVEIRENATRFTVGRSVDLKSAPRAVVREQAGTMLIVTHKGLVRLALDFTAHPLVDARWGMLYPSSVAVDAAGIVYVGMRGVVARLTPAGGAYREEWLFPPTGK
jgi:hypothetical protein